MVGVVSPVGTRAGTSYASTDTLDNKSIVVVIQDKKDGFTFWVRSLRDKNGSFVDGNGVAWALLVLDGKTDLLTGLLEGKQGWKCPVALLATCCGSKSLKVILIDSDFRAYPVLNPLVTL
jgi:hypothetical protein